MKKLSILIILTVLVIGICMSSADAASFSCKTSKAKTLGKDKLYVTVSKKAQSENGISVRTTCGDKHGNAAHHKLDKVTIKYKVGKKSYTKIKKLGYKNDYNIKMPKHFKISKITVKYHKATSKEYKKLKANWPWT